MRSIEELNKAAKEARDKFGFRGETQPESTIKVAMGEEGLKLGSDKLVQEIIKILEERKIYNIAVELVPFWGSESTMPKIEICDSKLRCIKYGNLDREKIQKIIIEHLQFGKVVEEFVLKGEC